MTAPSSHKKWFNNNRGLLVLALVTIAFYIHNLLSPEFLDDYVYKFVFDKTGPDYSQRISNLWDVFRSQYGFGGRPCCPVRKRLQGSRLLW